jgi:predicted nucleic acid-binding protein
MKEINLACFLDTNILVYAFDSMEGLKHICAKHLIEDLWETKTTWLSTQVLLEFHSAITRPRSKTFSIKESQAVIRTFLYWKVYSPRASDVVQAVSIQERYRLSIWDAMIIQSAVACGCKVIYSEDLNHGQEIEGIKIVNPFMQLD